MPETTLPRRLFLLRHAKSSRDDPELADFDRPLAPRGKKAAARMAAHMDEQDLMPEWVLCSSAARTRATFELIAPVWPRPPVLVLDPALYLAAPRALLARLRETPARISTLMMIGHNPGLHELARSLAGTDRAAELEHFPTAALAVFESEAPLWSDLGPDNTALSSCVTARELG